MPKKIVEVDLKESPYKNAMIHNRWHPDIPIVAWVKPGDDFEKYASGYGLAGIAKALNEAHVPPPMGGRLGWCPTAIRDMLKRDLYRGIVWWNRTQTIQRDGTKKQRQRPQSEWPHPRARA